MKVVNLSSAVVNGSVVFSASEPAVQPAKYFSQPEIKRELEALYKERYQLNSWRTFDESVMKKVFGK